MVTTQGPAPVQYPVQPWKLASRPDCAVRVTTVPLRNEADALAQSRPQLIPDGVLLTEPRMEVNGVLLTFRVKLRRSNRADTVRAAFIVTSHAPAPLHAPDQPTNEELASGCAVNETSVPCG